jgi:hypothetical protein
MVFLFIHLVVYELRQMTPPIVRQSVSDIIQNNLCDPNSNWNMSHYLERINHYYDSLIVPLAFGILDELAITTPLTFENLLKRLQQDSNFQSQDRETASEVLVLLEQDSYLRKSLHKDSITYTFRFLLIQQYWRLNRGLE